MHGAFRRGLFATAFLGSAAFLAAVACSTQQEGESGRLQQLEGDAHERGLSKPARGELKTLLGHATLPFSSNGRALLAGPSARAGVGVTPSLTIEVPLSARGSIRLHPSSKPEHSLALSPVLATSAKAALAGDGSAVYEGAFGSADLVHSATLEGLRTQIAIRDGASPDLFVWSTELGSQLRPVARDDLGTDLVDSESKVWLSVSPVKLTDARGVAIDLPLRFEGDGFARLRVDHRELAYPASLDFGVTLGSMQALAVAPTLIKGRVMVLLDTSGSMIWQFGSSTGTHGDGPRDSRTQFCDNSLGNGSTFACTQNVTCTAANGARPYWQVDDSAQPSRMLASKLAMQNVVNAYSGLLDFGLERYAEDANCPDPTYCCITQTDGTTRGRCGDVGEYTDIPMSGVSDDLTYTGSCGTAAQGGRVLVSPGPTSGTELLPWVDFVEDFCSSTAATGGKPRNPELRGNGSTPLARSIITAREDWYRPVYTASKNGTAGEPLDDSLIDCRPYVLVVMTDGDDTCSISTVQCDGDNSQCGGGTRKCIDTDTDTGNERWRCPCVTAADCNGASNECVADPRTQDCNDDDAQCTSGACIDAVGGGTNWRCSCATNADCGTGQTCNTTTPPEVDCRDEDARCISGNCFDLPNTAGTNWRCACNGNAQCPATQQCTNGRCVTRGVCQAAGRCDRFFEPRPRAQVQTLTSINATNPVKTYVLGMGNPATLNQTELNAMAVNGGTAQARFANNQQEIEAAFADIVANTVKYEICNSADDNCNARIDEGLGVYQECLTAVDCNGGACNAGRCVCNGNAQCAAGYSCSNEAPTRFCRPSCSEGQGACFAEGVRKCGVGVGQCCVNNNSATCTDITPPAGTAEVCNGIDDNCNGFIDENLPCQGCVPLPEVCDGKDNDCDGKTDESDDPNIPGNDGLVDTGGSCGSNIGRCTVGTAVCTNGKLDCSGDTGPFTEVCNGYDDDCDGVVDGMSRACYTGMPANTEDVGPCHGGTQMCTAVVNSGTATWGMCQGQQLPTTEVCNGIDDDCNGTVDDGIKAPDGQDVGDECCGKNVSMAQCGVGACSKGTWVCAGNLVVCDNAGTFSNELCDNIDNDCNGEVDDITNIGGDCEAPGGCSGTLQCDSQAQALVCVPDGATGVEVCNGLDDDCDGKTDEIEDVSVNDDWWGDECNAPPPGHDVLPCKPGVYVCKNGQQVCEGDVQPLEREVCDLKDNDCDGIGDTLAACPGDNACVQGVCVEPCHGGEFPCPGGYECDTFGGKRYCVPTTCDPRQCPPGASCQDGQCTLTGDGGAGGNDPGGDAGNGPSSGGEGTEPGSGGADDSGGMPGSGATSGNGTSGKGGNAGNETGDPDDSRGVYGLVTGGGGCSCRTAPLGGGKWALGLSLLVLGSLIRRRRAGASRRAA